MGTHSVQASLFFRTAVNQLRIVSERSETHAMGIRFPSIPLSKYTFLVAVQLVVNVSLAVWLYDEYLHNPFMQAYMSNLWSTIGQGVIIALGVAVGAGAIFAVYGRSRTSLFTKQTTTQATIQEVGASANLDVIDNCPFCDLPLKTISEGRLQCRSCRRYFKSSLPKVAV
jgi:hypothetical protein